MSPHFNDFTSTIRLTQNIFGKEWNYGIYSNDIKLHFFEVFGPRMVPRCDGIFGTWYKILIPVSHLNYEGVLMFLEQLNLVNCFEFSIRLQFAGIAGGDPETTTSRL